jgi:hypothetical protein
MEKYRKREKEEEAGFFNIPHFVAQSSYLAKW